MRLLALALAATLVACTPHVTVPDPVDTGCIAFRPITLTKQDKQLVMEEKISQSLVDQILAHNETGERRCGWKGNVPSTTMAMPAKDPQDPLAFPVILRNSRHAQDPLQNAVPRQDPALSHRGYGRSQPGRSLLARADRET